MREGERRTQIEREEKTCEERAKGKDEMDACREEQIEK